MRILQNFQKFRVRVWMSYRTSKSSGYCGTGVQNSQKSRAGTKLAVHVPRVLWAPAYRTSKSSGYRYEYRTELPEVCSGYGCECPTELTEVRCRVIHAVNTPGTACTYPTEHNLGTKCKRVLIIRVRACSTPQCKLS